MNSNIVKNFGKTIFKLDNLIKLLELNIGKMP